MRIILVILCLWLVACAPSPPGRPAKPLLMPPSPSKAGLVLLPCSTKAGAIRPEHIGFCVGGRAYVRPDVRDALVRVSQAFGKANPGSVVLFMDASGADGRKPFYPHLSHGDGRQVDLAVFYTDLQGRPLAAPPKTGRFGYGAYEPPRPGDPTVCKGVHRPGDKGTPADRRWRLDDVRTRDFVRRLVADPRVRRVFIEPHLKKRFGLQNNPKVRFAGCKAARHDDHIHVDFV